MNKTRKKYIVLVIVTIVVSVVALLGASYALLTMTLEGDKTITLTAGILKVDFTDGNYINLDNAAPISDAQGQKLTPYTFTITNTGNINAYYHVSLEEEDTNTLTNNYLKMRLTNDAGYDSGVVKVNSYGTGNFDITSEYTLEPEDTVTYTLCMWLDETADNSAQGKEYKSKIVVTSYDREQKSVALQQILEDNELQEETTNMFNYASNGMYISGVGSSGPEYSTDENQVTNGLYSMDDEDGISYYYRGNVDNNNVQFGQYDNDYYVYNYNNRYFQSLASCQEYNSSCSESNKVKLANAGDKMYWKIVRVNGDGSLRLIYNGTSANPDNSDLANSYLIGQVPYNLERNDPKYAGYTYDNGTDSFIKKEVDTWYSNTLGNSSYDSKVSSGRFCSDSSGYREETMMGGSVFASFDRLGSAFGKIMGLEMQENVTPTLKCPTTSESYGGSYRLKAGLITADELVLAGESMGVIGNSYLNSGSSNIYYWSMTPAGFNDGFASVWGEFDSLYILNVDNYFAVRPVINVTTDNGFTSGDGAASNPYILS